MELNAEVVDPKVPFEGAREVSLLRAQKQTCATVHGYVRFLTHQRHTPCA